MRPAAAGYRGTAEEDEALRIIFEKTYGPAKSRQLLAPVPKEALGESAPAEKREPLPERRRSRPSRVPWFRPAVTQ